MRACLKALPLVLTALLAAPSVRAADEPDKSPEHKITQSKSYLMIDPIYTTIVEDNHPVGMLMVGVGIDVPDEALRDTVTRSMPVLRDAYVRSLMSFSATTVRPNAQPDVSVIAARLQSITDRALNKKGARILLAQVALRVTK